MYQFFVPKEQEGRDFVTITGQDAHHIKNVLRMRPGEIVRVSGETGSYHCSILELGDDFVQLDILDEALQTELSSRIYLFQALPKGGRMEYIIQKAVELGVYEMIPVAMKYCVVKLDEKKSKEKVKRWQAVAESAAKQSKRSLVPKVHSVMSYFDAVRYAMQCDRRIVPYENERGMEATREAFRQIQAGESISVMIGPEGGFAPEEIEAVRGGMQVVSFGRRILRTDTAAVTAMSLLMMHLEALELSNEDENGSIF